MRNNSVKMQNNVNLFWYYSEYYSETGNFMLKIAGWFGSKNQKPTLKTDGQNCCALLLGLRNGFYLHQNLLIAKDLQIKSMAIFFLYPLQLQALTAFLRRARDCYWQRRTIPATAFCTTFSAKVSETQGRKSLEHYCLLSTIYKMWQGKDLM